MRIVLPAGVTYRSLGRTVIPAVSILQYSARPGTESTATLGWLNKLLEKVIKKTAEIENGVKMISYDKVNKTAKLIAVLFAVLCPSLGYNGEDVVKELVSN